MSVIGVFADIFIAVVVAAAAAVVDLASIAERLSDFVMILLLLFDAIAAAAVGIAE